MREDKARRMEVERRSRRKQAREINVSYDPRRLWLFISNAADGTQQMFGAESASRELMIIEPSPAESFEVVGVESTLVARPIPLCERT
jgi:hypothetical protein